MNLTKAIQALQEVQTGLRLTVGEGTPDERTYGPYQSILIEPPASRQIDTPIWINQTKPSEWQLVDAVNMKTNVTCHLVLGTDESMQDLVLPWFEAFQQAILQDIGLNNSEGLFEIRPIPADVDMLNWFPYADRVQYLRMTSKYQLSLYAGYAVGG